MNALGRGCDLYYVPLCTHTCTYHVDIDSIYYVCALAMSTQCVCVCVCITTICIIHTYVHTYIHVYYTHTHTHTHTHVIIMYMQIANYIASVEPDRLCIKQAL